MEKDLRVCHVVNAVGETSIPAQIATGLGRYTEAEATVLAWFSAGEFPNQQEVNVEFLDASGFGIKTLRRARDVLSEHDVVHTHHNHAGSYGKVLAALTGTPVLSTEHNNHGGFGLLGRLANGTTNALADGVTCVSESVCDSFAWWEKPLVSSRKRSVVYNGVDLERVSSAVTTDWELRKHIGSGDSFVVGISAMHTEQKAHDVLIRAVAQADDRVPEGVELVVTGDGPLRPSLEQLAHEQGVGDAVHFLGIIPPDRLYKTLHDIDAFSMPSRWEGFCVAVAEAMAVGTPCVLSDIDVFEEVYGAAALRHPVDDVDALADRLVELAQNDTEREKLGKEGKELVKDRYSLRRTAKAYADCYREIL